MKRLVQALMALVLAGVPFGRVEAAETEEKASAAERSAIARDQQSPSPGGGGKARATVVDTPDFSLAVRGFAQFSAAPWVGKDALLENGDVADFAGMRVRRLSLGLEGRAAGNLSYDVWVDLASGPILSHARLAWTFRPELTIEAGVVKVPFSKSAIQSSTELLFTERPLAVERLLPDRQPGVAVYGSLFDGIATYRVGVFNGAADSRAGLGNDHPGVLVAGRVAVTPLGALRAGQVDIARGAPRLEIGANSFYDMAAGYDGLAFGGDVTFQGWGFSALVEYVHQIRTPLSQPVLAPSLNDRVVRNGFIAQASYLIWEKGLAVAARAERVDDNDALQDVGDVDALAAGLHWYVAGLDVNLNLDWYHRIERFGPQLDNDGVVLTAQGRF